MRKFLGVSLVAVLAVSPMMAQADVATVSTNDTTVGVASTKYVKEAYNAMAGAVNAELGGKGAYNATATYGTGTVGKALQGKQDTLTTTQLAAANSGITSAKVSTYDGYASGKQDTISDLAAIRSGATAGATALQEADITTGTDNGKITVGTKQVAVKGLGSAAYTESTAYATSAQGTKADNAADKNLSNLSTTGKANVSAKGTYDATATYDTGTVGKALQGKQDTLTTAQLNAANSGITSAKVSTYDGYASGKQDTLTTTQLAAANSGITSAKVSTYDGYASGKQDTLTTAQLAAANSGITSAKVSTYDGYATGKANVDLDNLSTTGKANVSAKGTYDATATYDTGTVGKALQGKQNTLTAAQLNAANSGITSAKVSTYDGYASGKQDKLTTTQLAAANSGITSAKVSTYDGYASTISSINSKVLTIYNGWNGGAAPDTTSTVALTTPAS